MMAQKESKIRVLEDFANRNGALLVPLLATIILAIAVAMRHGLAFHP